MRTIVLISAIALGLIALSCQDNAKPILITGSYKAALANTVQDPHEYKDTDIKSVYGVCKFNKDDNMFSVKFADGAWSDPNTTYFLELTDVADGVPASFKVIENKLHFEPAAKKFHCTEANEFLSMEYVDDQTTGEKYYLLKINCSGAAPTTDTGVLDAPDLTNLQTGTGGIKFTNCDGY